MAMNCQPSSIRARASSALPQCRPGATLYFQGNDDHAGPLTKYAITDADP